MGTVFIGAETAVTGGGVLSQLKLGMFTDPAGGKRLSGNSGFDRQCRRRGALGHCLQLRPTTPQHEISLRGHSSLPWQTTDKRPSKCYFSSHSQFTRKLPNDPISGQLLFSLSFSYPIQSKIISIRCITLSTTCQNYQKSFPFFLSYYCLMNLQSFQK